eukprot:GFUD01006816.1.p1 GENE.GFUD01006816.1~~GFUD01006816.1.p1  ORF type:complete len:129 (-),score=27.46 GFUD01006816.1:113-499(-)
MNQIPYFSCFYLLLLSFPFTCSLSCIQCSSIYSSSCISSEDSLQHLYPCPTNQNYTLCRKIDQTVRGVRTVMRRCGWEGTGSYCYKTVSDEYSTQTCSCYEDGCNKGGRVAGVGAVVWMMAFIVILCC